MNVGEFFAACGRHHHEAQIVPLDTTVKHLEFDAQLVTKVRDNVFFDVGFGRRRQAQHGRGRCMLTDELRHVAIVGTKVVPPLGQAMGLVKDPCTDLALFERAANRSAAQLLRSDDQDAGVAKADAIQCVGTFRHGQQSVDGHATADPAFL